MKRLILSLILLGGAGSARSQKAKMPDISEKTAGPVLKRVMRIMGDSSADFKPLYDTIDRKSKASFVSVVPYPGAAKTLVSRSPNRLQGDNLVANATWECTLIEMPSGTSGGFDAELVQFEATLKRLFPRIIKTAPGSFSLPGGVQLYLFTSVNSPYKVPDYFAVHVNANHTYKVPPAARIINILNRSDSLIEQATSARHCENYACSIYEDLRVEGIVAEKIVTMYAPLLSKADIRFPGLAFNVLMRLPHDADVRAIAAGLTPAQQASVKATGQRTVNEFNAQYRTVSTAPVSKQQPAPYRQPTVIACDHCSGRGYFLAGKPRWMLQRTATCLFTNMDGNPPNKFAEPAAAAESGIFKSDAT